MDKNKKTTKSNLHTQDENIIVGRNPVIELLKSEKSIEKLYIQRGAREGSITKIFSMAKERSVTIVEVDKSKLDEMACGNAHQGVAAVASAVEYVTLEQIVEFAREKNEKPLIIVLDGVEDPHNIGAIIRCAECAGAHGIVIGKRHSAVIGQTVFKSSAGAAGYVPIAKVSNIASAIDELKELGVWTYAADMDGESCYSTDFNCPAAIVMGNEGFGVSRLVKEKCDFTVSIPMYGKINSLNVSTAAAVLLFEAVHNRNK